MKPQNSVEINKKYAAFFGYFFSLLLFSLLCIYFLFRTHQDQMERLGAQQASLNTVQNQQMMLSDKMDKLLRDFKLVNSGEVQGNSFLISEIGLKQEDMARTYQKTDTSAFPVYGVMLREMRTALILKDSISSMLNREAFLKAALNSCITSYGKAQQKVNRNSDRFR
jgi:hypothetical protein